MAVLEIDNSDDTTPFIPYFVKTSLPAKRSSVTFRLIVAAICLTASITLVSSIISNAQRAHRQRMKLMRADAPTALAAEDRFESHASSAESASDFNQTMAPDAESAETDASARREHDGLLYAEALDMEDGERSLGDR